MAMESVDSDLGLPIGLDRGAFAVQSGGRWVVGAVEDGVPF
jgi:hypothetical protein